MASSTKPLIYYTDMLIPEAQKFFNFFSICHTDIESRPSLDGMPDTIYHYTSINSLKEIIKGSLFFTKYDYLNDISEIEYGIDLFKNLLKIKNYSSEVNIKINKIIDDTRKSFDKSFILCFSEDPDSMQMWKYYGQNDGYNIGINSLEFLDNFDNAKKFIPVDKDKVANSLTNFTMCKVIYEHRLQQRVISNILDVLVTIIVDGNNQLLDMFTQLIANCIYFYKSEQFANEKEIRFIIRPKDDPICSNFENVYLHHRVKCGSLIPYLNLEIVMPIEEITIGPYAISDMSEKGLKSFLRSQGFGEYVLENMVTKSKIKLRY